MKTRKIGELTVSAVGMGCMAFSHGYGQIPPEAYSIEAIQNAYRHGCTFFDTAEIYSPNLSGTGHNERIVGKALRDVRQNIVLATKLFLDRSEVRSAGSVYDAIHRHLDGSLDRLQTDMVDLYYLHRTNGGVSVEEVAEAMGLLIEDGLIRGWGLSQVDVDMIDRAQKVTPLTAKRPEDPPRIQSRHRSGRRRSQQNGPGRTALEQCPVDRLPQGRGAVGYRHDEGHHLAQQLRRRMALDGGVEHHHQHGGQNHDSEAHDRDRPPADRGRDARQQGQPHDRRRQTGCQQDEPAPPQPQART